MSTVRDYANEEKTELQKFQEVTIRTAGIDAVNNGYQVGTIGFANMVTNACEEALTFYRFTEEFKNALQVAAFQVTSLPGFLQYPEKTNEEHPAPINNPADAALCIARVLRPIIKSLK